MSAVSLVSIVDNTMLPKAKRGESEIASHTRKWEFLSGSVSLAQSREKASNSITDSKAWGIYALQYFY